MDDDDDDDDADDNNDDDHSVDYQFVEYNYDAKNLYKGPRKPYEEDSDDDSSYDKKPAAKP
jgi:hypothetical protein